MNIEAKVRYQLIMNTIIKTKKKGLLFGLTTILVTTALLSSSCNNIELLGKAQIAVYEKGEKMILDPQLPHYKQLQAACEEMLTSSTNFKAEIKTLPNLEEVKNQEWAIELIYSEPIIITIPRLAGSTDVGVGGYQVIVPLTGTLTDLESTLEDREIDNKYTYIFLLPEEMGFPSQIIGDIAELVGTKKDVQKIKDILICFDIDVP